MTRGLFSALFADDRRFHRLGAKAPSRASPCSSAISSRSSPGTARSAIARRNAPVRRSLAGWPWIRTTPCWRGQAASRLSYRGGRGKARWCCGWRKPTRKSACRSRTSRCPNRSKSWCAAGSTREHHGARLCTRQRRPARPRALSSDHAGCGPVRALEVVLPTNVTLPAGRPHGGKGGAFVAVASRRAVAGRVGPGAAGRQSAPGRRDFSDMSFSGTCTKARPAGELADIPGAVHALAFSRDGRRLAVGARPAGPVGSSAGLFCPRWQLCFTTSRVTKTSFTRSRFDPTERNSPRRPLIRPYGSGTSGRGGPTASLRGHSDFVYSVTYTPDGRALLDGRQGPDRQEDQRPHAQGRTHLQRPR